MGIQIVCGICYETLAIRITMVQLEGNLTKTYVWQAKKMRLNSVNMPQIHAGTRQWQIPRCKALSY